MVNRCSALLFSAGTRLAYSINKEFYKDTHYVWCASNFHTNSQPPTSDPQTICSRLLDIASTGDKHTIEITSWKTGIMRGAKAKYSSGDIDSSQHEAILKRVKRAKFSDFAPVLYVIDFTRVGNRCHPVMDSNKASTTSNEFLIETLYANEFQIIDYANVYKDHITLSNSRAEGAHDYLIVDEKTNQKREKLLKALYAKVDELSYNDLSSALSMLIDIRTSQISNLALSSEASELVSLGRSIYNETDISLSLVDYVIKQAIDQKCML